MKFYVPKSKLMPVFLLVMCFVLKNAYVVRQNSLFIRLFDSFEWGIYFILILSVLFSGYKVKQLLLIGVIAAALGLCYLSTGQADLLKACILIVYLKGVNERQLFTQLFQAFAVSVLIVFFLYVLGISDAGTTRRDGIALGFATANVASRMIQCVLFSWLVAKRKEVSMKRAFVVAEATALFIMVTTNSRASMFIVAVSPLLVYVVSGLFASRREKAISRVLVAVPVVMLVVTVASAYLYESNLYIQILNATMLSNRVFMNYVALDKYGIGLLGNVANISSLAGIYDSVAGKYINFLTIDSHYTFLLVYYGLIGTAVWMITNVLSFMKAWRDRNAALIAILLMLNVYALTETMSSIFAFIPLMYLLVRGNEEGGADFGIRVRKSKGRRYRTNEARPGAADLSAMGPHTQG